MPGVHAIVTHEDVPHNVYGHLEGLGVPADEAARLFENRRGFDFSYLWCCSDDVTLFELSRAAAAIGRTKEAESLREKALATAAGTFRVES